MNNPTTCITRAAVLASLGAILAAPLLTHAVAGDAPTAEELLADMPLSDDEKKKVMAGELVTIGLTNPTSDRELGVGIAFLIKTPPEGLVDEFARGVGYEEDEMATAFGVMTPDATVADLADVHLAPNTAKATQLYLDAAPGDTLNLDKGEIAAFKALGAGAKPEAIEAEIRKMLLARFNAYRTKGTAGIEPYVRKGEEPYMPGNDLDLVAHVDTNVLEKHFPEFYKALQDYPRYKPDGLEEAFFWVNFSIDDLPTFTLVHKMGMQVGDGYVLGERHYYVSRSHNVITIAVAVYPAKEGAVVFYGNRTSTDQVAGFGSSAKHSIGRKIMAKQIAALFEESRVDAAKQ